MKPRTPFDPATLRLFAEQAKHCTRYVSSRGYIIVYFGLGHPRADGRGNAYEHQVVAEAEIGRRLRADEHVHHVDHDRTNNAPGNLRVMSEREHGLLHHPRGARRRVGDPNPVIACACGCGRTLRKYDNSGRPRRFIYCHNPVATPNSDAVLTAFREQSPLTVVEVRQRTRLGVDACREALQRLVRLGFITRARIGTYVLANDAPATSTQRRGQNAGPYPRERHRRRDPKVVGVGKKKRRSANG